MPEKHLMEHSDVDGRQATGGGLDDDGQTRPAAQESLKDKVDQVLNTLTYREREIIKLRYGIGNDYIYKLEEVGRIFKVPEKRVQQITAKAIRKLQHPLRSRELERFVDALAPEDLITPEGRLLKRVFGLAPARWPPSFFNFATSERCQDAFISWLIAWAHGNHREANGPLHRTGVFFLGRLLGLHGLEPPANYTHLNIRKYKRIDVLVSVNREFVVLIEDKIDFSEHSGQLERYLETVQNDFKHMTPVPVYLKTGDQLDYAGIEKAGWKCFFRNDLLEVLSYGEQQGVDSDVFRAFHSRLRQMEVVARRRRALRL